MKTNIRYTVLLILIAFNNYCLAQPGWYEVSGSLNDLTKIDIENCLNSDCRIKFITIDSSTDLNKLSILENLESLALQFDLQKIPVEFSKLKKLKYLVINSNNLNDVSELAKLDSLDNLTILDYLKDRIPQGFEFLQNIKELQITGEFKNIAGIEKMINLKKLTLSSKRLTSLPNFLSGNSVESLTLSNLNEEFNFSNLSSLNKLKSISLYESSLKKFPDNLTRTLKHITVWRANQLTDIQNIELYITLDRLFIYFTAIEKLPSAFFLSKIKCLEISGNKKLIVEDKEYNIENCKGIFDNGKL